MICKTVGCGTETGIANGFCLECDDRIGLLRGQLLRFLFNGSQGMTPGEQAAFVQAMTNGGRSYVDRLNNIKAARHYSAKESDK